MKNCRKKLRGVVRGSLWSDSQFNERMGKLRKLQSGKKEMQFPSQVVTEEDFQHAVKVLRDFLVMEPKFAEFLNDDQNWEHGGDDDSGTFVPHDRLDDDKDCGCGCG
jgi:hypothetical protein